MLAEIDAIIASRMDKPDRSALIREAVAAWLISRKEKR
jgi:metal-responsive CopG/Arc/MetJ family transcriptional regulator